MRHGVVLSDCVSDNAARSRYDLLGHRVAAHTLLHISYAVSETHIGRQVHYEPRRDHFGRDQHCTSSAALAVPF
eukprot:811185-Rhodomonas_salina.8